MDNVEDIDVGKSISVGKVAFYSESVKKIRFLTEQLTLIFTSSHPKVMLLFSNPHPGSLLRGMFHSNQSTQSRNFWKYLQKAGLFKVDTSTIDSKLADKFITGNYESDFQFYFHCFYSFPSPSSPDKLKRYFGDEFVKNVMVPKAKDNIAKIIQENKIQSIICFNQDVFNILQNNIQCGNTTILDTGSLVSNSIKGLDNVVIYYIYPTRWYNPNDPKYADIEQRAVSALKRIKEDILARNKNTGGLSMKNDNSNFNNDQSSLWQIYHSPSIKEFTKEHIVFTSKKDIKKGDFVVYEIMPAKLAGLFEIVKSLNPYDEDYHKQLADKEYMKLCGLYPMPFQYKITPVIEFFNRPMNRHHYPDLDTILKDKNEERQYAEKIDSFHLKKIREIFEKHKNSI
ncbi:MAG: hypothetical protein P9L89_04380 [Candidatus Celaenobacter polaris]|nr:hypothetical protein [Candidatus Celaenobacter polaris]